MARPRPSAFASIFLVTAPPSNDFRVALVPQVVSHGRERSTARRVQTRTVGRQSNVCTYSYCGLAIADGPVHSLRSRRTRTDGCGRTREEIPIGQLSSWVNDPLLWWKRSRPSLKPNNCLHVSPRQQPSNSLVERCTYQAGSAHFPAGS